MTRARLQRGVRKRREVREAKEHNGDSLQIEQTRPRRDGASAVPAKSAS